MLDLLPYLCLGLMGLAALLYPFVAWERHQQQKEQIRDALREQGCRKIRIERNWFDFDKHNSTYFVQYTDADGQRIWTTGKIHNWEGDLYWRDSERKRFR